MKKGKKGRIVRSIIKSSICTMKMIHSKIMNSISVDVVLTENAVSQCKGKGNRKGGHHFHDTQVDHVNRTVDRMVNAHLLPSFDSHPRHWMVSDGYP
jgi:hypothetical protein